MVQNDGVEAYNWPQGVITRLYHSIAARQPGVITKIGLNTFVDPRCGGGRLSGRTAELLNSIVVLNGETYILYNSFPIHACLLRLTSADAHGNLSSEREAVKLEWLPLAMATRNSGGVVIAQVEKILTGRLHPRAVDVPAHLVDYIVQAECPETQHRQCVNEQFNAAYNGDEASARACAEIKRDVAGQLIAARATKFLREGEVVNIGSGLPELVGSVLRATEAQVRVHITMESGVNGGIPAAAPDFGLATDPQSIIRQDDQFNYYQGGGLDTAVLGFAEVDGDGNVNVSKFGGRVIGCGGFIDIAQSAKRVLLCGTFNAKGLTVDIQGDGIAVVSNGAIRKLVNRVEQVTFSGQEARKQRQEVWLITERCVMRLSADGWVVTEVTAGVDLEKDVLQQAGCKLSVEEPLRVAPLDLTRARFV